MKPRHHVGSEFVHASMHFPPGKVNPFHGDRHTGRVKGGHAPRVVKISPCGHGRKGGGRHSGGRAVELRTTQGHWSRLRLGRAAWCGSPALVTLRHSDRLRGGQTRIRFCLTCGRALRRHLSGASPEAAAVSVCSCRKWRCAVAGDGGAKPQFSPSLPTLGQGAPSWRPDSLVPERTLVRLVLSSTSACPCR